MPAPKSEPTTPAEGGPAPDRTVVQYLQPAVDGGRYPIKRCAGDLVHVSADIFRDGHELLRAIVSYEGPGETAEAQLTRIDAHLGGVRWAGSFTVPPGDGEGRYVVEAWTDLFGTWRDEFSRKVQAGQEDLSGEISEGVVLLQRAAETASAAEDRRVISDAARVLGDPDAGPQAHREVALSGALHAAMERSQARHGRVVSEPIPVLVERLRARFGSWYELFPRSFGGLSGVTEQLPRLAELGFDVLYLPPIHPIGVKNRKGRDNALIAGPGDPGSPWAIGKLGEGGHEAVHPELGTHEDVRTLCATAASHGIEIALDLALQASADHPWLTEHPEWFNRRPDGTLKYAENPPKRYQDIYNFNWDTPAWRELWEAIREIVFGWVDLGVKVFRVDNPHTKPYAFWEWLIAEVHREKDPEVIFLAEAFTKRAVMRHLAKIGFTQSYTYFTWKNWRWELTEYMNELAGTGEADYFRPNFFANTPDILHEYLQRGGRPAFEARLILAGTLSPTYGIYSGFEDFENVAVREGSEEYLHSEKYETKHRSLDGPLLPMVQRLNTIRRENPALQTLTNLTFLDTANDGLLAYAKSAPGNTLITVVNLDPHWPQEGSVNVPAELNLPPSFGVRDLLTGATYQWHIGGNYVRLAPYETQAHIFRVEMGS